MIIKEIMDGACKAHENVNHFYDKDKPYKVHLEMVVDYANKYLKQSIPYISDQVNVISAAWWHDTIEDCRLTYNDVKMEIGATAAEIVYALTNEKGRNRAERGNDKYYQGIRETKYATYVKICDRLANMEYSRKNSPKMYEMYLNELSGFLDKLRPLPEDCQLIKQEFQEHLRAHYGFDDKWEVLL